MGHNTFIHFSVEGHWFHFLCFVFYVTNNAVMAIPELAPQPLVQEFL